jgi:hypothetical protein
VKNKREGARCPADALRDYDEVAKVLPFAAISMLAHDLASALRDTLVERDRLQEQRSQACRNQATAETRLRDTLRRHENQKLTIRSLSDFQATWEQVATQCLLVISGAGICTPAETYLKAPSCLAANIRDLRSERDQLRAKLEKAEAVIAAIREAPYLIGTVLAAWDSHDKQEP